MKMIRNTLLAAAAALVVLAAMLIVFLPHISLRAFASAYNLDLQYKDLKRASLSRMVFDDLTVIDRVKGIGVSSRNATIDLMWSLPNLSDSTVGFCLYDVRFVKSAGEAAASYDTLDSLVALPFSSNWIYKEISGKVRSSKGDVKLKDFLAKSDLLKLSLSGEIHRDNTIKSDIVIYFSDELTGKIPPELTRLVLTQEEPGWKSLSVKLEGNYAMPTINVSSKLFRLNIGVKDSSS